ncbi:NAD(P)H-quinone oxidoreductase [Leucobacter sp. HY1910]
MRAVEFAGAGGPDVVRVATMATPKPGPGEVLIRVAAAGLNRADAAQRQGVYPPPPGASEVPGLEVSGVIVAHGGPSASAVASENTSAVASTSTSTSTSAQPVWPVGTEVCALLAGGGYAEYAVAPVSQLLEVPAGTSLVNAAALPEVAATVVSNLNLTATVKAGDWVLVHGGSGGIGTFALQYLAASGARTIATGSTDEKLAWARDHGALHTINYRTESFAERTHEITGGHGADVILDVVGAKYLPQNVQALATGGRLVVIGLGGGRVGELDLGALLTKRAGVFATSLRARPLAEKAEIIAQVRERVWPLVEAAKLQVPVDRTFTLAEARAAHTYFDSGEHRGKVLLTM